MAKFNIELTAKADVRGSIEVEAGTREEAVQLALSQIGDVEWKYNGVDDETVEAN